MFKSATVRLTLAYLGISMAISLFFSFILYQAAVHELQVGLERQSRFFQEAPKFPGFSNFPTENFYDQQLAEGKKRIIINLVYTNLIILGLAGAGSYFLARRTLRPIELALEAQTRFSADASHELRTPLTAMQTEIEVALRDKNLKLSDAKAQLESNLEEVQKLKNLAEGLLALSRHQAGQGVAFTFVSLIRIIEEAEVRMGSVFKQAGASLNLKGHDIQVEGDKESLISLFMILFDNAVKYSSHKPIINIAVEESKQGALIRVIDNGIGIDAKSLPHVFERFYRADTSRSKHTSGYGLGLSIAKQIVSVHKGEITASSTPGIGSEFTVKLPIKQKQSLLPE